MCENSQFKHVLHGFSWPVGCPLAWWWLSWRGWRTSWCLRRVRPSKLRWLPGGPWQLSSGISDQSWSPGRFLWPISGRGVFWSEARCSFGIFWFLSGRQFLACICGVSWLHRWLVRSYGRPWWQVVFVEPFLQWIYGRSALYEPLRLRWFFWIYDTEMNKTKLCSLYILSLGAL